MFSCHADCDYDVALFHPAGGSQAKSTPNISREGGTNGRSYVSFLHMPSRIHHGSEKLPRNLVETPVPCISKFPSTDNDVEGIELACHSADRG